MLAVSSVDARKPIMRRLTQLQEEAANKSATYKPLRIATISFAANEEQNAIGEISDETF